MMKRVMMMTHPLRLKMSRKQASEKNLFLREENNPSFWPHRGFVINLSIFK
jgi:hypothetical protein